MGDDFQGEYGPSSPQAADPHTRRAELSPVPGGETLQDEPEKSVLDLINKKDDKKAPGSHIQLLVKRPWTHHVGMRPRQGSRQGRMAQRGCHKGEVAGTSQGTEGQIPGYAGFMPASDVNSHAKVQADGSGTRPDMKDSLFASFRKVLPGYRGFQPAAASESLIIKEMFTAPLDGRPSDNGLTNAQLFYQEIRPYEGLPRVHYPNARHQVGCRFPANSVSSMKDS